MQPSHAKTIRGLGIAVVVLSALSILGFLLSLAFVGVGGAALNDPSIRDAANGAIYVDPESARAMEELGMTTDDAFGLMGILLGLGAAYIVWGIICSIIALIAGIICMKNSAETGKLGKVFGWSLAGAILSFLYGNLITMVLLIVSAVFASKDRKAATAIPYGQPNAYYAAPQQPYAAPQQPYGAAPQPQQPYGAAPQPQPYAAPQPQPYTAPQQQLQQPTNGADQSNSQQ